MEPKGKNKKTPSNLLLLGLAVGLYPLFFYYTQNFTLINSWKHLGFFIVLFLGLPVGAFYVLRWLSSSVGFFKAHETAVKSFLSSFLFLSFLQICLFAGVVWWAALATLLLSFLFAYFGSNHFDKLWKFQLLLAFVGLFSLVPRLYTQLTYSEVWMEQPDAIESAVFKKKPNVYYIQPDGYVNFSEISKGQYEYDNEAFKKYLVDKGFTLYDDFRSNYTATLESNMATFAMKHHYFNNGFSFSEITNAREVIVGKNPVLDLFKSNGYETHLLLELPYLLSNHPKLGYDHCNFDYDEVSLLSEGFSKRKEILPSLQQEMATMGDGPQFYFMQILDPGHVEARADRTLGAEAEKEKYFEKLERSNEKLRAIIDQIKEKDPTALILIMADHGGYVGFDYMLQIREKQEDESLLRSAFSVQLAIHWPDSHADYDLHFKSAINTFRILFAYLSEEKGYLNHLQEDASFTIIKDGNLKGIYQVINDQGEIVFQKSDE